MPDIVLNTRMVTNGGLPTGTLREGFLVEALADAGYRVPQSRLKAPGGTVIDDGLAATIVQGVWAARERTITYTHWVRALDAVRSLGETPSDTVHRLARTLEKTTVLPADDAERRAMARMAIEMEVATLSLNGHSARQVWRDRAIRSRLQTRLDSAWLGRVATEGRSAGYELYADFLTIADPYSGDEAETDVDDTDSVISPAAAGLDTRAADEAWRAILAAEIRFSDDDSREFWLTDYLAIDQPSLGKAADDPNDLRAAYPLDRSIAERISRMVTGGGARLAIPGPAVESIERVIDASALPLGLSEDWARRVMGIGHSLAQLMSWDADSVADRWFVDSLMGGRHRVASRWRREIETARRKSSRARTADAVAFYQNPGPYLAGKLWLRVLRHSLRTTAQPTAQEVWDLVHGAYVTTRKQLRSLGRYFPDMATIDQSVPGSGRTSTGRRRGERSRSPIRSGIDDVLQTAIDLFGASEVSTFWDAVAAIPAESPVPRALEQQWAGYLRAEVDLHAAGTQLQESPEFSVPFEHLRRWIDFKGPLRPDGQNFDGADEIGEHER